MTDDSRTTRWKGLGALAAPTIVLAAAAVAWGLDHDAPDRRRAIVFAAGTCLIGGLAAWLVGLRPARSAAERVSTAVATTTLRLLPALAGLAWLQAGGAEIRAAGGGELLLVFYLAALAADLARIIMMGGRGGRSPGADRAI